VTFSVVTSVLKTVAAHEHSGVLNF